jgi:hypothetical protein
MSISRPLQFVVSGLAAVALLTACSSDSESALTLTESQAEDVVKSIKSDLEDIGDGFEAFDDGGNQAPEPEEGDLLDDDEYLECIDLDSDTVEERYDSQLAGFDNFNLYNEDDLVSLNVSTGVFETVEQAENFMAMYTTDIDCVRDSLDRTLEKSEELTGGEGDVDELDLDSVDEGIGFELNIKDGGDKFGLASLIARRGLIVVTVDQSAAESLTISDLEDYLTYIADAADKAVADLEEE